MYKYIYIIIASFVFSSCTKEIDIDLNSSNTQLVIEGNITDQPGPYTVKLSKTVNFSDANVFPTVSGATVIISDNTGVTDTLAESVSGSYLTNSLVGIPGNTYTLKVIADGKQYDAVSTMPYKVNLDSIRFNLFSASNSDTNAYLVIPMYLDPVGLGNSYRFFLSSNRGVDKRYQVNNDNIGDGNVNQRPFFSDDIEFHEGDTVSVTMLCIDVNTYNYYYTLSQISRDGPGGGPAPSNPPNNITGNKALGIFSAYTTQTRMEVVQ